MLVDFMDTGLHCPPMVPVVWIPNRCDNMILRVVVQEIESWLLADVDGIAQFLGIAGAKVPKNPELLVDPKQTFVNLARLTRKKSLRDALVPRIGTSSVVGPEYASTLECFIINKWDIASARANSSSLHRCIQRLGELHV